ncbi:stage II sporulation protein D [Desulfitispora alkaliphila]|uniref:SpoIID/LytB domain-containing protein n=1 Tax=Desulfitispora alkaliphila TaxID=622674 RepID=UPI003D1D8FFF
MFKHIKAKSKLKIVLILTLAVIAIVLTGCPQGEQKPEQPEVREAPEMLEAEPQISVYMHETGATVEMGIEEYLQGVVAAEMEPTWHEEALAAQAIIARSFTMKKIEEGGVEARGTDASTDINEFQAYSEERVNDNVVAAVERTRGEVALYNGEYINAWFHADAGGITATAQEGLDFANEEPPYIHSVEDPGIEITEEDNKAWEARFPLGRVQGAVQEIGGSPGGGITSAEIVETGPSGRATVVRLGDAEVSAPALRLALDSTVMRSTLIDTFEIQGNELVVAGKGYGHGVGMSQWGARYWAEDGSSAEDIVAYYFKDVEIMKMWE